MTKETNIKLEKYLEQNLAKIEQYDPFLYNEMQTIYEILKDAEYPLDTGLAQGPLPMVSSEEAVTLAAEFLEKCNPEYKEKLLNDYYMGKITFNPKKESIMGWNANTLDYNINIRQTNIITMASELVHEYFHTLNINLYVLRSAFTEIVSITAELMFLEFLKEKNYNEYTLNLIKQIRRNFYNNNLHALKLMFPLYLDKKENSFVSQETYQKLPSLVGTSEQNIDYNIEKVMKTNKTNLECYTHTIGYIHAREAICKGFTYQDLEAINEDLKNADFENFLKRIVGNDTIDTMHTYATKNDFVYQPIKKVKK